MAVGTGTNVDELMYSWFATHVSMPTQAPIEDRMRAYFVSIVGEQSRDESVLDLERRWLRSLTGVTSNQYGDMWREAVVGAGLSPASDITQNKVIYFSNVS